MKQLQQIVAMLSTLFLLAGNASAVLHDLGALGATYPIAEKDAIEEIEEKASKTDWSKHFNKKKMEKAVKGYRPENLVKLPRAGETRSFNVDMTYTLDFDITDNHGQILYPKGFMFNPLDYIDFPRTLIVIDATDEDQVAWLKSSDHVYTATILITDGAFWDLSNSLGRALFYADKQIVERFGLKAVPSIIRQSGRYMEVKEIAMEKKDETDQLDSNSAYMPMFD